LAELAVPGGTGPKRSRTARFLGAFFVLRGIELFVAHPVEKLCGLALRDELSSIGADGDE
jgi:hypothetical protein